MISKPEIDVALVAGCRPDVLGRTLASFSERLFRHFSVRTLFANIDPIWGDASEGDECEALLRQTFERVAINRPAKPGFGQAVKTVWQQTGELPVFHLEDDWIALEDITPAMILPLMLKDVGMIAPAQRARKPQESEYAIRTQKVKFLGVTIKRKMFNGYGTSPRFIAAGLANRFGALLNPRLDPEKQILHGLNKPLVALQSPFRCRMLWGAEGGPLIEDIGRDWREARRIRKVLHHGEVSWVSEGGTDPGTP